jgi:hypothetical protein
VIQADILPFGIQSIQPNYGGNTGRVTVELLGAKFTPEMEVWLEKDSTFIDADTLIYVDFHKAYAVFNLEGQEIGKYTLNVFNFCIGEVYIEDGFEIVAGMPEKILMNIYGLPPTTTNLMALTFQYINMGNTDVINGIADITSLTDVPIGLSPSLSALWEDNHRILSVNLQSDEKMPGVLRPGTYEIVTFFIAPRLAGVSLTYKKR